MNEKWSHELKEQLKQFWGEGLTSSEIARKLGNGISRSAVIGKAHRLHLARRAPTVERKRHNIKAGDRPLARPSLVPGDRKTAAQPSLAPIKAKKSVEPAPLLRPHALRTKDGDRITILNIGPQMCRWPIGDPREEDFHFCGHRHANEGPYCDYHASIAYQPLALKRKYQPFTPQNKRDLKTKLLARAS